MRNEGFLVWRQAELRKEWDYVAVTPPMSPPESKSPSDTMNDPRFLSKPRSFNGMSLCLPGDRPSGASSGILFIFSYPLQPLPSAAGHLPFWRWQAEVKLWEEKEVGVLPPCSLPARQVWQWPHSSTEGQIPGVLQTLLSLNSTSYPAGPFLIILLEMFSNCPFIKFSSVFCVDHLIPVKAVTNMHYK